MRVVGAKPFSRMKREEKILDGIIQNCNMVVGCCRTYYFEI
jgi:hypothetical protein